MYKNLKKISTIGMDHDEWLEHRKKAIGGSDASAIVGLNPYSSPYSVWAEKRGITKPKADNEAMRLGRDLEEYVAKRFTEATGKKVRRENAIIYNPHFPFAHANIDRMVIGEDAILECKTCSALSTKNFKNGAFPDRWYGQCVHYAGVLGVQRVYLAVLILGVDFMVFELDRDEAEIEALMTAEADFWNHVETNTPPTIDGAQATTDAIKTIYADSNDDAVDLFGCTSDLDRYIALNKQIKELEEMRDEAANKVKVFMAEAGNGECDRYKVSWKSQTRRTFDSKKFAADHKELDLSGYYKSSTARIFRVNEIKGA